MSNVKCPDPFRSLTEAVRELISAARSVNISRKHEVSGLSDDEPCYWQRKAWVDFLIENGEKAQQALEALQKQQAQVVGRVHHNEEHAEPVRAALNSIGRELPDDTQLYAHPPPQPGEIRVQVPVAWQSRFTDNGEWAACSREHFDWVKREPQAFPAYEARELYALPPQQPDAVSVPRELESLRKDAERYRGVRRVANKQGFTDEQFDAQTDERIFRFDAALKEAALSTRQAEDGK